MQTGITENTLRKFLLGNCSDAEAEAIGVTMIDDPEYAETVLAAEDDLIEDFLDEILSDDDRELFLSNFMTTPARLEKLEQTSLLRKFAKKESTRTETVDTSKDGGALDAIIAFLTGRAFLAGAAILIVAISVFWFLSGRTGGLSPLELEYAALNSKDLTNAPEIAGISNKSLAPDVFRGAESTSKLRLAGLSERVLLRLALPVKTTDSVDAEVTLGGKVVFRQKGVKVYSNPNGAEVKLLLPRSILSAGNYQIRITGDATYAFAIE